MALDLYSVDENGGPWDRNPDWKWIADPAYFEYSTGSIISSWSSTADSKSLLKWTSVGKATMVPTYDTTKTYPAVFSGADHNFILAAHTQLNVGWTYMAAITVTTGSTYEGFFTYEFGNPTLGYIQMISELDGQWSIYSYTGTGNWRLTNQNSGLLNFNTLGNRDQLQVFGVSTDPKGGNLHTVTRGSQNVVTSRRGTTQKIIPYDLDPLYPQLKTPASTSTVAAWPYTSMAGWGSWSSPNNTWLQYTGANTLPNQTIRSQGFHGPNNNGASVAYYHEIRMWNRPLIETELAAAASAMWQSVLSRAV